MKTSGQNPYKLICEILLNAVHESVHLLDENQSRRAQLTLECALEDVDAIINKPPPACRT